MNSERRVYVYLTYASVAFFALFPLLFSLPFRIHLDLPYEGAYRLYMGQIPFKDYTMPLSYGFFVIPTICFYLFGPYLKSLLIAQAIVTVIGSFSFMSILRTLKCSDVNVFISVLVFCLSYTFVYFWPWYNNTAFTYEILGISLLLRSFYTSKWFKSFLWLVLGTLFLFLTFFTKQDYGGLAFMFGMALIIYISIARRTYYLPFVYLAVYAVIAFAFIFPLLKYDFLYWFNLGRPPHQNRLQLFDIINEFFLNSEWEKFYLLIIVILLMNNAARVKEFIQNEFEMLMLFICVGFIFEAIITKITSNQSLGNTTFYHGFAVAFILSGISFKFNFEKPLNIGIVLFFVIVWWSGMYWKYAGRMFKPQPQPAGIADYSLPAATSQLPQWELSEFKSLEKVKLPVATIEGIRRIKQLGITEKNANAKILNMTELTMLAYELPYKPLEGLPLWYHLNVGIFQSQVDTICLKISQKDYDMVLFEEIPSLDNFFPEQVRDSLRKHYQLKDAFLAPRKEGDSTIEVYLPR